MGYFITHSGRKINPANISAQDVYLEDIAHHLTKVCRFGGSLPLGIHYSVAQHSILMAKWAYDNNTDKSLARMCLLHDASEAYLGDVLTALKKLLPDYQEIEHIVTGTLLNKYLFENEIGYKEGWDVVSHLDKAMLLDEALAFFPTYYKDFSRQLGSINKPLGTYPQAETNQEQTKQLFLYWCKKLNIQD